MGFGFFHVRINSVDDTPLNDAKPIFITDIYLPASILSFHCSHLRHGLHPFHRPAKPLLLSCPPSIWSLLLSFTPRCTSAAQAHGFIFPHLSPFTCFFYHLRRNFYLCSGAKTLLPPPLPNTFSFNEFAFSSIFRVSCSFRKRTLLCCHLSPPFPVLFCNCFSCYLAFLLGQLVRLLEHSLHHLLTTLFQHFRPPLDHTFSKTTSSRPIPPYWKITCLVFLFPLPPTPAPPPPNLSFHLLTALTRRSFRFGMAIRLPLFVICFSFSFPF